MLNLLLRLWKWWTVLNRIPQSKGIKKITGVGNPMFEGELRCAPFIYIGNRVFVTCILVLIVVKLGFFGEISAINKAIIAGLAFWGLAASALFLSSVHLLLARKIGASELDYLKMYHASIDKKLEPPSKDMTRLQMLDYLEKTGANKIVFS